MGVATTNVLDRVMASVGLLPGGVAVRFERCEDVSQAGVLLALPALLACGLLRHSAKYFHLPEGYYTRCISELLAKKLDYQLGLG